MLIVKGGAFKVRSNVENCSYGPLPSPTGDRSAGPPSITLNQMHHSAMQLWPNHSGESGSFAPPGEISELRTDDLLCTPRLWESSSRRK
jgi:hypothetical protein